MAACAFFLITTLFPLFLLIKYAYTGLLDYTFFLYKSSGFTITQLKLYKKREKKIKKKEKIV
jgi:hypothetical protein